MSSVPQAAQTAAEPKAASAGPQGAGPGKSRSRVGLAIGGGVLLLAGIAYSVYWLLQGQFIITTDDAYLKADAVSVAPRVSGYIDQVMVTENQKVLSGQPLLHIDLRNYRDAFSQQQATVDARSADIGAAESQIHQQEASIAQSKAQLQGAQANAQFAREQAERYRSLRDQGAESDERYAQAVNERNQTAATEASARASLAVAQRQLATLQSQKQQSRAQLEVAEASANTAKLNLDDTVVKASIDGIVGDSSARVGQYVQPGTRLMSIVPVRSVYLVANFKETQLKRMRIGQRATIKVDALDGTEISAQIESFSPGTGSQFALLPPENATGNFIKIVQRVPVRFKVMPSQELSGRLLPGLSATVRVDTRDTEAK